MAISAKREANADIAHPDAGTAPRGAGENKFGRSSEARRLFLSLASNCVVIGKSLELSVVVGLK